MASLVVLVRLIVVVIVTGWVTVLVMFTVNAFAAPWFSMVVTVVWVTVIVIVG